MEGGDGTRPYRFGRGDHIGDPKNFVAYQQGEEKAQEWEPAEKEEHSAVSPLGELHTTKLT